MAKTYTFFNDPGHGYLEVPVSEITPDMVITPFSFISKDRRTVYLEEDCDAPAFFKHTGQVNENRPILNEVELPYDNFIRRLNSVSLNYKG